MISDAPTRHPSASHTSPAEATAEVCTAAAGESAEVRVRRAIEEHFDSLWRFLRRLGVTTDDVDDGLQEVILIAVKRRNDIARGRERGFLFGTAFRVAKAIRRRRMGRREVGDGELEDHPDPSPEPDVVVDHAQARALLDRLLSRMPTDLRAVLALYEIEEMTMAEIADVLEIPPGTVASRLRRAREDFAARVERLQEEGWTEPSEPLRNGNGGRP